MALEQIGALLLSTGLVCLAIAALWIWIVAWKVHWQWGLGLTLFAPAALIFIPRYFARVKIPVGMLILASVLIGIPYGVNAVAQRIDLGPREKVVNGEVHITLTGWDQKDYSILQSKATVVVLQMANPDVTDETLNYLHDLKLLREIDLNDTQITDRGLAVLKELPVLKSLRLRGTKITDAGFQRDLAEKDSLMELDVRETSIASKTMRKWNNAREGRKYLK
jgi:hypothetical protein